MEFLQKHYEKIILSVVLLGLAVAAAWLPIKVSQVRETLEAASDIYQNPKIKPLPAPDLSTNLAILKRLNHPAKSDLGRPGHNVFSPIQWKKKPDGTPFPMTPALTTNLVVTEIHPLYTRVEYEGPRTAGQEMRYQFRVVREASTNRVDHLPSTVMATLGARNKVFLLKDIKGEPTNPTELYIQLNDGKETITVTKDKPFRQVAGYAADLKFDLENKAFTKQRPGQRITLADTSYNIVAVTENDVTLEHSQTKKRTTIRLSGAQ